MSGKGSGRRPQQVDEQTALDNWQRCFPRAKADASPNKLEADNGNGEPDPQGSGQAEGFA
jgi:hypothetical protein